MFGVVSEVTAPADASRYLILGLIENYSWDQLAPFILSLRETNYAGKIVFLHHGIDLKSLESLQRHGVTLIPFHNLRGATSGMPRRFLDFLSERYHSAKWPEYSWGWRYLLHSVRQRYYLFHRYLSQNGGKFDRVLLTDTRDVFFQRDPFSEPMAEDLIFFEESHPLNFGKINTSWIWMQFGAETFHRLSERVTLCAGTTIGRPEALCHYLNHVVRTIRSARRQDLPRGDQAIHNVVVYEELDDAPFTTRICANHQGQVATLTQYLSDEDIRLSANGEVVDADDRVIPIVHQYDRHPRVMQALLRKLHVELEPAR